MTEAVRRRIFNTLMSLNNPQALPNPDSGKLTKQIDSGLGKVGIHLLESTRSLRDKPVDHVLVLPSFLDRCSIGWSLGSSSLFGGSQPSSRP